MQMYGKEGQKVLQMCILRQVISLMKDICFNGAFGKHLYSGSFPLPSPYSMNIQQCPFLFLPPAGKTLLSCFLSLQALPCQSGEKLSAPLLSISILSPLQKSDSMCFSHLYSQNCCSNQKRIIKTSLKRAESLLYAQLQKRQSTNSYESLTTNTFNMQRKA